MTTQAMAVKNGNLFGKNKIMKMKTINLKLVILVQLLWIVSCQKNSIDTSISDCINDKIEAFKNDETAKAVYSITRNEKQYYWMNTDATYFDGVEYIFGNDCENACQFCGECALPDCTKDFPYDKSKWTLVWKK